MRTVLVFAAVCAVVGSGAYAAGKRLGWLRPEAPGDRKRLAAVLLVLVAASAAICLWVKRAMPGLLAPVPPSIRVILD